MTRLEENQNTLNSTDIHYDGRFEEVLCKIESNKLGILMDISKSLAMIADNLEVLNERRNMEHCTVCRTLDSDAD